MDSSVDCSSYEYGESTTSELVSLHQGILIMQAYVELCLVLLVGNLSWATYVAVSKTSS
jgi:hypothetical protein